MRSSSKQILIIQHIAGPHAWETSRQKDWQTFLKLQPYCIDLSQAHLGYQFIPIWGKNFLYVVTKNYSKQIHIINPLKTSPEYTRAGVHGKYML